MNWLVYAILSAVFAALTAILAKIGIKDIDSNLATAIRTVVVLVFAWGIVMMQGSFHTLKSISRYSMTFLVLSGLATGLSWLFYFRALQLGSVAQVAPIDKISLALTIILSVVILHEHVSLLAAGGVGLMITGAILVAIAR